MQDQAEVIRQVEASLPSDVSHQVRSMEHDFFQEQPVAKADVYFLHWILHDWSDTYAVQILRALRQGLRTGVKIIINEFFLPEQEKCQY